MRISSAKPSNRVKISTFGGGLGQSRVTGAAPSAAQKSASSRLPTITDEEMIERISANAKQPVTYIPCEMARIDASLLDPTFVRNNFVKVTTAAEPSPNDPRTLLGSLDDRAMGASKSSKVCSTCSDPDCSGHNGYIDLGDPENFDDERSVIPPFLMPKYGVTVRGCANIVCMWCSRLMIPEDVYVREKLAKLVPIRRVKVMEDYANLRREAQTFVCANINPEDVEEGMPPRQAGCNTQQEVVSYEKETNTLKRGLTTLNNMNVYLTIKRMTRRDAKRMGQIGDVSMANMLMQCFPVLSPNLRQGDSKEADEGSRQHMEQGYRYVIKELTKIHVMPLGDARDASINNVHQRLLAMVTSSKGKKGTRSANADKHAKGVEEEVKGKTGIIRLRAMGKREDYSSRGVVTGDDSLRPEQVGVPDDVWRNSYDLIYVMAHNVEHIKKMYAEGLLVYYHPPEQYFKRGHVRVADHVKRNGELPLRIGDAFGVVMRDGAPILFGRNPSIHKGNILCGTVKRDYGNTFRHHNSTTVAQNRDYDGDEGNYTFPQEPMQEAQARILMSVAKNIVNTENSATLINGVMDSNTAGLYGTATKDMGLAMVSNAARDAMLALITERDDLPTLPARLRHYGISPNSMQGILSALFPASFFYKSKSRDDTLVIIRHGVLLQGTLTKPQIGIAKGSIPQVLYNQDDGPRRALGFINDMMLVLDYYLSQVRGLSVGLEDLEINNDEIHESVKSQQKHVKRTIALIEGAGTALSPAARKRREPEAINFLQTTADAYGHKITKEYLKPDNPLRVMIRCGAKGDIFHMSHMVAQGGQQYELGARLPKDLYGNRGSFFDPMNDKSITSAGYVSNSLGKGFNPREQISHHKGSRVSLVDTVTKTVDAGEYHHLQNKALMDLHTAYDYTLRDVNEIEVQPVAGGGAPGLDPFHTVFIDYEDERVPFFCDPDALIDQVNGELATW